MSAHIVALSGGKDSTALALALAEREPRDYSYVCTPTGNELPEMQDHWRKIGALLGKNVEKAGGGLSLVSLILQERLIPNHMKRFCTKVLKLDTFRNYVADKLPATVYLGIRADETDRDGGDWRTVDELTYRYPFVEWGWTRRDVESYLCSKRIEIPERTDCAFCFYQTVYEWYRLWQRYPRLFDQAKAIESLLGHSFRYKNDLKSKDDEKRWPARLELLQVRFEAGEVPKQKTQQERTTMCSICAR